MAPTTTMMAPRTAMMAPTTTMMEPTTTMMEPRTAIMESRTAIMESRTAIMEPNTIKTKYQSIPAKYLELNLEGYHFAGILILDSNGKNIFYDKNISHYNIVSVPETLSYGPYQTKNLNNLFKQTINVNYDREKGSEYNTNILLNDINYTNTNDIFSYPTDGTARICIFDINPGKDENILVSSVIVLFSQDKCSIGDNSYPKDENGLSYCIYDNVRGFIKLYDYNTFKTKFNLIKENLMKANQETNQEIISNIVSQTESNVSWRFQLFRQILDEKNNPIKMFSFNIYSNITTDAFKNIKYKNKSKFDITDLTDINGVNPLSINSSLLTTTITQSPATTMMASSTGINKIITKYQAFSCKFLNITLNKLYIAGIIVLDENGKNIFYGKNYNDIEALPINTTTPIIDASEPNRYRKELYKKTNELFKQTVNINYDNSATDEYNINLLNQIDYVNPANIFSLNDNITRDIIINLNPGENKGNILVSKVIILLSKNICDNGIPCSFNNLEVKIALFSADYTPVFDWLNGRNLNPLSTSLMPIMPKIIRLDWKYNNNLDMYNISENNYITYNSKYILNFKVSDVLQNKSIEEFKNIKVKSKFYDIGTVIFPIPNQTNSNTIKNIIDNQLKELNSTRGKNSNILGEGEFDSTPKLGNLNSKKYSKKYFTKQNQMAEYNNTILENLPKLSPSQIIELLNSGVNLDTLTSQGIAMNSAYRGPSTNIVQTNFRGTSDIYSPYLYYNKGVNEQFSGLSTDTNQNYSSF